MFASSRTIDSEVKEEIFHSRLTNVRMMVALYDRNIHTIRTNEPLINEIAELRRLFYLYRVQDSHYLCTIYKNKVFFLKHKHGIVDINPTELNHQKTTNLDYEMKKDLQEFNDKIKSLLVEEFTFERKEFFDRYVNLFLEYKFIFFEFNTITRENVENCFWLEIYK